MIKGKKVEEYQDYMILLIDGTYQIYSSRQALAEKFNTLTDIKAAIDNGTV